MTDSLCQPCGTLSNWCCEKPPRCQDGSTCNQITNRCVPPPSSPAPIACGDEGQVCCKPPSSNPSCNGYYLDCFANQCFDFEAERTRLLKVKLELINSFPT